MARRRSNPARRALAAPPRHPPTPLQRLLETGAAEPERIQGLVEPYTAVSSLTLKPSIDRQLRMMPPDHYSSPPQRWMVADDA
jgi:hypothetical protein